MCLLVQYTTSPELQQTQAVWRSACDQTLYYSVLLQAQAHFPCVLQQVMDQFSQMRTILSSFLRQKQETTKTAFCNYLASEVEALGDKDFQTFRNEAVKLISSIQSRAEERGSQPQQPQQQTLSQSSSAISTFVPQTFHQSQQPAPSTREYIVTIPKT